MPWRRFLHRARWDQERAREIEAYLDIETADNLARGMPAAEARRAARRKFGNPTFIREEIYRMNTIGLAEGLWQDLRYGLRVLRKSPAFAAVTVLSLALGIGANAAVFSVVRAVLLRPLPYPEPRRLVVVAHASARYSASMAEFEFWKEHAQSFASVAGIRGLSDNHFNSGSRQEWITVMTVTADFFRTLAVPPALGREFNSAETRRGGPRAIVLSHDLWLRAFDGSPDAIGPVVTFGDAEYTVIGVAAHGFWFEQKVDAFLPLRNNGNAGDLGGNTEIIARLKPGVGLQQADAEMRVVTESFRRVTSGITAKYRGLGVTPYHESLAGDVRLSLLLLFAAVGLLLLIACSNLASLVLARLAMRRKEIALRLALGSSRARLLRQFLIENTLLTTTGGLAGFFGARILLDLLLAALPFQLPTSAPIQLDSAVLGFAMAVALLTGIFLSLAPIARSARCDVQEALKAGGRGGGGGARLRTRNLLVMGEVALSVSLLVAAGLLIQSLYRIHQERLGFNPRGLITFYTPWPDRARGMGGFAPFQPLLERIRTVPGVREVAASSALPLTGPHNYPAQQAGRPDHSIGGMEFAVVTPGYLQIMGTPIVRGRDLSSQDTAGAAPVILVSEGVVREWWPNGDPLSGRVVFGLFQGKPFAGFQDAPRQVVGVVADTKANVFREPPRPTVYIPAAQAAWWDNGMTWVVRADLTPGMVNQLRQAITDFDPAQRVQRVRTMEEIVAATTADSRFDAWLFGAFALLALVLTTVGVYGLLSFSVAQRTGEIGTRMALGASRADVLRMVLGQGVWLVAIGLALGLAGALVLTRSLTTLLFGVRPADPLNLILVAVLLLSVGLLASYFPARRATKVDPMVALRYE